MEFISQITVNLVQFCGGDHTVVAAARVSIDAVDTIKWMHAPADENAGLIDFLMKRRHGTPFEHSFFTFFVHAPIFVFREWHRHRVGFSYNESSGRYSPFKPVFWIPRRDRAMVPGPNHKPAAPQFVPASDGQYERLVNGMMRVCGEAWNMYQQCVTDGIALEVASRMLPTETYSSCWVSCNPRSIMHFLSLRVYDPDAMFPSFAQAEIQEAAQKVEIAFAEKMPITHDKFLKYRRVSP